MCVKPGRRETFKNWLEQEQFIFGSSPIERYDDIVSVSGIVDGLVLAYLCMPMSFSWQIR
jgi:hypothetical protein